MKVLKVIIIFIVDLFLWGFSRSPILSVTRDRSYHDIKFGALKEKKLKLIDLRFSLISLGFGPYKIYFCTLHNGEDKLIEVLRRRDIIRVDYDSNNKLTNAFKENLLNKKKDDKIVVKEFIQHQIQDRQSVFNYNSNKVGIYSAISVMIVTIIATSNIDFLSFSIIQRILLLILAYNLLNMIAYTIFFLSVKEVSRASLKEIEKSDNYFGDMIASLYYDSICLHDENKIKVSTILDIERYMKYFIFYTIIYILISAF